jgi:DNA-binding MarR family transcriptional regulator
MSKDTYTYYFFGAIFLVKSRAPPFALALDPARLLSLFRSSQSAFKSKMSVPTPQPIPPPSAQKRLPVLLRRAWYGLNQAFRQRVAHLEITPDQFSILRWLSEGDPEGLTQRKLTDLMASDPNTITSTLSRMEAAGLIERLPHELDRRAHRVKMLPSGRRIFLKGRKIAMDLQEQVLAALPGERGQQFLDDLEIIGKSCAEVLDKPAGWSTGTRKLETPKKPR